MISIEVGGYDQGGMCFKCQPKQVDWFTLDFALFTSTILAEVLMVLESQKKWRFIIELSNCHENSELSYCGVYMHVTRHGTWNVAANVYDNSCGITYKVAMHFYTTQQWVAELRIWEMRWTLMLVVEQAIGKSLLERWYRRGGLERQYQFCSSFLIMSWWCLEAIWSGWVWQSCITASCFKCWWCLCTGTGKSKSFDISSPFLKKWCTPGCLSFFHIFFSRMHQSWNTTWIVDSVPLYFTMSLCTGCVCCNVNKFLISKQDRPWDLLHHDPWSVLACFDKVGIVKNSMSHKQT